ncbi:hypothetical protein BpHYR1_034718, partial [Brachionus plicatilis]
TIMVQGNVTRKLGRIKFKTDEQLLYLLLFSLSIVNVFAGNNVPLFLERRTPNLNSPIIFFFNALLTAPVELDGGMRWS